MKAATFKLYIRKNFFKHFIQLKKELWTTLECPINKHFLNLMMKSALNSQIILWKTKYLMIRSFHLLCGQRFPPMKKGRTMPLNPESGNI
jgi:hypothetical protein